MVVTAINHQETTVKFILENTTINFGENIYIVGNTSELGDWNIDKAVGPLKKDHECNTSRWHININLPAGLQVKFKFIKKDNYGNVTWQEGFDQYYDIPLNTEGCITTYWENEFRKSETNEKDIKTFGPVLSFTKNNGLLILHGKYANLLFAFYDEDILRVKLCLTNNIELKANIDLDCKIQNDMNIEENSGNIICQNKKLKLIICKKTAEFKVYDHQNNILCVHRSFSWDTTRKVKCENALKETSHIYGLGENTGFLDKYGERYTMWNFDVYEPHVSEMEYLYLSIPFFIHLNKSRSYGIFVDNTSKLSFDFRTKKDTYYFESDFGSLDFYLINGSSIKNIITNYTNLTGRIKLPPLWSLGYHQSKYSYNNQDEVMTIAEKLRDNRIPSDSIHLDIKYMDTYKSFTFDDNNFPDPKSLLLKLKDMGFELVPIINPGIKIDSNYTLYKEGIKNNYFCKKPDETNYVGEVWPGKCVFPDYTNTDVLNWWSDTHKIYTDLGFKSAWNDMNEPAIFIGDYGSKTMDNDVIHENNGSPKTHAELHNLYGYLMTKSSYIGMKKHLNGIRPFVLTRSGYSGVQKYAAVWTGDNRSFWEHLSLTMPMVLNLGLSGIPFSGSDVGGFSHHCSGELLIRWTQMGALLPFFRNHSNFNFTPQEPWAFGQETEQICRKYIELRYKLISHLYNLFYQSTTNGLPIVRPLILEYESDINVYNLCDQFLLGEDIIVAPIYRPNTKHRTVYLPEGQWYDYWTNERFSGNQHIMAFAPLDKLPLYVRCGCILIEETLQQNTKDLKKNDTLILNIYGGLIGKEICYEHYEDDGYTFNYERGIYNIINFEFKEESNKINFKYSYRASKYKKRKFFIVNFKHIGFVPSSLENINKYKLDVLLNEEKEGWALTNNGEIIVKLKAEYQKKEIVIS